MTQRSSYSSWLAHCRGRSLIATIAWFLFAQVYILVYIVRANIAAKNTKRGTFWLHDSLCIVFQYDSLNL